MPSEQIQQWRQNWEQLIAPDSPYAVVSPAGQARYFAKAPGELVSALQVGRGFAERPFVYWQDRQLSFREFYQAADRLTAHLVRTLGVRPGERVAIAMRNRPEWMVAFVAVVQAGAVPVLLNSWGLRDELLHALHDSRPVLLIADLARMVLVADDELAIKRVLVEDSAHEPGPGLTYMRLQEQSVRPVELASPDPDSSALILYTSGTTSRAKGVVCSHRSVCQALFGLEFVSAFAAGVSPSRIKPMIEAGLQSTSLLAVPLFHVSGLYAQFLNALRTGKRLVMMYKWDVDQALALIQQQRCTQFSGAPVMMQQLLAHPRFNTEATASLFGLGLGGGAASSNLLAQLTRDKPTAMAGSGYGLTESNGIGAAHSGDQFVSSSASAGWPLPIVEVHIGDYPHKAPAGQSGAIWLRSPTLMQGYWERPQDSAQVLVDGWLFSGDVGFVDEDGYLHITDRIKDLIIRGGENISAVEVEHCACGHEDVLEAAAFALADEQYGETVALAVHLRAGSDLGEAALKAWMARALAAYKVPTRVWMSGEPLPRNASGKVLKAGLKQRYLQA
ncbi:class I adenylate-forming enzyme family protein [Pseudomonas sp. R5(2019)]|uniref:class I adenylate-forming enzyme family protein n=1 Tax=Pseudomonas sp. R5(2019) TaxID=2697566 RepID=UPI001411D1D3|nr:class I adenylate-forming enzyme family protein [Pseudomonas sp. R5(2019)]NBA98296.1 AMP-binding protein [Pseudomonas sp. R5(2019)]